jgi:hypothetical protein
MKEREKYFKTLCMKERKIKKLEENDKKYMILRVKITEVSKTEK